jgi:D-arabinose 1-dehydrogenase-like Zn-dependent alcohol dehydrogenase
VLLRAALASITARGQVVVFSAKESKADLEVMRDFIEQGAITPVIDRRYDLSEVPQAFADQGAGHAKGRKVISVAA